MNFTLLFFVGLSMHIYAQLNPVNGLNWQQWYQSPHNYFDLSWGEPNASQDTLVGYNIYRNHDLYRFQTDTRLYHLQYGENCSDDFLSYPDGGFWIHVTAIYNSSHQESVYTDSIYSPGAAMTINNLGYQKGKLFPNPTDGKLNVDYKSIISISLINQTGKLLKEFKPDSQIDLGNIPKGVYFIKLIASIH